MGLSTVNRIISLFDGALQALSTTATVNDAERFGMLVHHAMESKTRAYHTAAHVFHMCEGMNPRQVLAALFHDVVYFQLDSGFPLHCKTLLDAVAQLDGESLVLLNAAQDDAAVHLCCAIFGIREGQTLPLYGGMNEFLSAVVAARLLEPHLAREELLGVIACIEATIPFRSNANGGTSALQTLSDRVTVQYQQIQPAATPDRVRAFAHALVWDAVKVANRDVSSFAVADPGLFLSSTWLLIEESNAPLKVPGMYTVQEYRKGLARMDGFLRVLQADHVFQQFLGQPSDDEMRALHAVARRNIEFACDFLGAKITSIAIIEAIALHTGSDGPVSMFLGDIHSHIGQPQRIEDFLPPLDHAVADDPGLLRLFDKGRPLESRSDLTTSPLTAFVYRSIGQAGMDAARVLAHKLFDATMTPLELLQAMDTSLVQAIVNGCSQITPSRRMALQRLFVELGGANHTE